MTTEHSNSAARPAHGDSLSRLPKALGLYASLAALGLLAVVVLSRIFYVEMGLSRAFEFDRVALICLAAAFVILSLVASKRLLRWSLLAASSLTAVSLALVGCLLVGFDVAATVKGALLKFVVREHAPDIVIRPDDRYGYRLRPGARDRARYFDFDVTYTVDDDGYRVTPTPASPKGTVFFAGASFTFGEGVEDHEAFPHLMGTDYWPEYKVVNAGVGGWGPTQAYRSILDALERPVAPNLVVYSLIPDHFYRSHYRAPVTEPATQTLALEQGELVLKTLHSDEHEKVEGPELTDEEIEYNCEVLLAMARACRAKNVPFAVVLLQDHGRYNPTLVYFLATNDIPVLDLTRLRYERFTHDYHPNAADHARIARSIAGSFVSDLLIQRQENNLGE